MNVLVTGGAGFIGSNLVERLLKDGHLVRVIDNLSTGKMSNIKNIINEIEFFEGDIRDYDFIKKITKGIEVVFHQAALPSVPRSIIDPVTTNEVNVNGTINLLNASKENNVRRFIFASSSSVYGDSEELPKYEKMKTNPLSPYAVSKFAGEEYCRVFNRVYSLETFSLRYFNIFGPNQDPNSQYSAVIPKFITAILNDETPIVYGDGEQSRDFTFVENAIEANILASTTEQKTGLSINCGCHDRTTINHLISEINKVLQKNIKPIMKSHRPGDVKHSFADISLANKILNYSPKVSFQEGLKRTIQFYRSIII